VRHEGWRAVRTAAVAAAALGLTAGLTGAGSGLAGASARVKPITNYPQYVGGHGKASSKLSPVTIGIVNQQTSTDAVAPVWTTGAKLAQKYINQHTGGIDGHPLKLLLCTVPTTVASAATCGQEFADNDAISAVAAGAIDVGNTALESALLPSKKPIFFGVSLSTVDAKDSDGFILYGTGTAIAAPMATFAKSYLHSKSVSITYPSNIPAEVEGTNIVKAALKYEGIKYVYSAGFTSSDTSLTEPFEAAHAGKTTLLIAFNSGGPACSDTDLTLKSLGIHTKVLVNGPCDTPTIAKADGGHLPTGWYYAEVFDSVTGSSTAAVASFEKVATKYGMGALGADPWTNAAFGQVLTIARFETQILKAHEKITPDAITAEARAFRGPLAQGAPHLDCGGYAGAPALCNELTSFFQSTKPGEMKESAAWIAPPKGFKGTTK